MINPASNDLFNFCHSNYTDWNIEDLTGYVPCSSLFLDFSKAEDMDKKGIVNLFVETLKKAKHNSRLMTELVLVLIFKMMEHYTSSLSDVYSDLVKIITVYL